ncbi:NAD(P)-binding protein [Nadsonia fulvescens var. elongata DSM 6958]|uniref:NAD(P)-binding protein n=1 Tax=Nadsonia fulvescens var. elongata DSM 6958 TaxID=857566 RepID=A0A1E3PMI4_9ASCO|nr:NAD(P)-binding protein [Nadsonia fulvescens var. elongata DSM 6958]
MSSFGAAAASRIARKVVLITGASSGIGKATAYELAEAAGGNIKLLLTARREEKLIEIKHDLEKLYKNSGIEVLPVKLDVSKTSEITKFYNDLPEVWKKVDILVNNAGMVHGIEQVGDIEQSDIDIMFQTNVIGLIAITQAFLGQMKSQNCGDIVMLGSIAGRNPYPGGGIYCATKAAVRSFTDTLRKETINKQIRVIEIDPGAVETEFSTVRFRGDTEKAKSVYRGGEPLNAKDIAELITFAVTRRQNTVVAETLVFPANQGGAYHIYRGD